MPHYDVHLYRLYREKYCNVQAVDMPAAIAACLPAIPSEVHSAEEDPIEAMVDVIGDDDFIDTERFDLTFTNDGKVRASPTTASTSAPQRAVLMVEQIAILNDGMSAIEAINEAIDALSDLGKAGSSQARTAIATLASLRSIIA